jgi:hypothetical protein
MEQLPDGADLTGYYKPARTVAHVDGKRKGERGVVRAQSRRLTWKTITKSRALSATLSRVDGEVTRSLTAMRQRAAAENSVSTRAKDDVNRFTVAAHEFSRLNLQTQELAKAIQGFCSKYSHCSGVVPANPNPGVVRGQ